MDASISNHLNSYDDERGLRASPAESFRRKVMSISGSALILHDGHLRIAKSLFHAKRSHQHVPEVYFKDIAKESKYKTKQKSRNLAINLNVFLYQTSCLILIQFLR